MAPVSRSIESLFASLGGDDAFEKIVRPKAPDSVIEASTDEPTVPTAETSQVDDFWDRKEQTPAEPEPEEDEDEDEALREQKQFLEKHGYDWWNVPREMLPRYRPRPAKQTTTPLTADGNVDVTLDPRHGESTSGDLKLTPFQAICKFPYKFVSRALMQPLATAFFDQGMFTCSQYMLSHTC